MEELKINHLAMYFHPQNGQVVSMNLLSFGYKQFVSTKVFEKREALRILCTEISHTPINFNLVAEFAFNRLLDSIKISICFENFLKSLLLLNGFVIHKLEKNVYPDLYQEQSIRPILLNRVLALNPWDANNKIKGLSKMTLGMRNLLAPEYLSTFGINQDMIDICNSYFEYRNNLHLYMGEEFSLSATDYKNFTRIIQFINQNIVRIQNQIVDELGKGQSYYLPILTYTL